MWHQWVPPLITTGIFITGVVDDLRTRKVHNHLVLGLGVFSLLTAIVLGGWSGLLNAGLAFVVAAGLMLPMFYAGILGGGDVKLMLAASFTLSSPAVIETVVFSLIWGALLGLCLAITHGTLLGLLRSTAQLATRKTVPSESLHRMPFTVALLLGWLSHLSYGGHFL